MKFKEIVLEKLDTLNDRLDALKSNMQRHSMTPEQVFESYTKLQAELSSIRALINRE